MPIFSIIIPVYNAEKTINRSIDSVLNQTMQDFEIIVVDDGSTDSSYQILQAYSYKSKKIKSYTQKNQGPGKTRNFAISKATGFYIAFLDADDYWETNFLEKIVEFSHALTDDIIYLDVIKERMDGSIIYRSKNYLLHNLSKEELIKYQMAGKLPWGMIKVIKREKLNGFASLFTTLNVGEEAIFSYEVLRNSNDISFVDTPIYHYVQSSAGQHKKGNNDPWAPLVDSWVEYLKTNGNYDEFKSTINSLALKALCISMYRYATTNSIFKSSKKIKNKYIEYKLKYDLSDINIDVIDKKTKIILCLLKIKLYIPIIVASKIRKKRLDY